MAGRPRLWENGHRKVTSYLSIEQDRFVHQQAHDHRISIAAYIRRLVDADRERLKAENDRGKEERYADVRMRG